MIGRSALLRLIRLWPVILMSASLSLIAVLVPLGGVSGGASPLTVNLPVARPVPRPAWAHHSTAVSRSREPAKMPPGAYSAGPSSRQGHGNAAARAFETPADPPDYRRAGMTSEARDPVPAASVGVPTPPPRTG